MVERVKELAVGRVTFWGVALAVCSLLVAPGCSSPTKDTPAAQTKEAATAKTECVVERHLTRTDARTDISSTSRCGTIGSIAYGLGEQTRTGRGDHHAKHLLD